MHRGCFSTIIKTKNKFKNLLKFRLEYRNILSRPRIKVSYDVNHLNIFLLIFKLIRHYLRKTTTVILFSFYDKLSE